MGSREVASATPHDLKGLMVKEVASQALELSLSVALLLGSLLSFRFASYLAWLGIGLAWLHAHNN